MRAAAIPGWNAYNRVGYAVRKRTRARRAGWCSGAALLLALLAFSPAARAQADYGLEPSPPLASLHLPEAFAARLQEPGSRLVRAAGGAHAPICDVWWVKTAAAARPSSTGAGILYGNLQRGAVVGVLRFLSADAEDFRDQKLKPGVYTLRYAQVAPASEESGSAEYRDFLLLISMAEDAEPAKTLDYGAMARLSAAATHTGLPALMSLVPPNPAYKRLPAVVADDIGNCAVQVKLHDETGSAFSLSLLVVTPLKAEGGS